MKMNKKAEVATITIVLIVVGIITGLFIAKEVGLFGITTPSTPDVILNTSINRYFYDPAVPTGTNWECVKQYTVTFRTTDLSYGSNSAIALGNPLIGYGYSTGACTAYNCNSMTSEIQNVPGGARIRKDTSVPGDYCVCAPGVTSGYARRYATSDPDSSKVSLNSQPINSSLEISENAPIKDSGKFTCENGNVVNKFCVYNGATVFPSTIQNTCSSSPSLPCEYVQRTISGVVKDVVKCGGDYKPNIAICSSDTTQLFTTNSAGNLNTITCGVNGYHYCSSGVCAVCKHGTSWCDGSKVMSCSNNVISNPDNCTQTGFSCSQSQTGPTTADTNASCTSSIADGNKICSGNQQLIYSLSQRKYINGTLCRTNCSLGNCYNECTNGQVKCDFGAVSKCDVNTAGNKWVYYYGNLSNSACLSGSCNPNNLTCSVISGYNLGWQYCNGKQRQQIVSDTSGNLLTGGTIKQDIPNGLCNQECQLNINTHISSCTKLSQCTGKEGQAACIDGTFLGICNNAGDLFTSNQSCKTTLNNPQAFCDDTKTPDACSGPAAQCSGNFGCLNGTIYNCDANGYFSSNIVSNCNMKGCFLTTIGLPSDQNSQCIDQCGITNKQCLGDVLKTCTSVSVTDFDNTQKIFDTTKDVACIAGCSNSACTPQKSFIGKYCSGTRLMESYNDAANIAGGGISTKLIADCTSGCQGTNGAASCIPIHTIGKYCSGTLGKVVYEAVADSNEQYIKDGGIKIIQNIQTCALDCMDGICTTNCNGNSECGATDGKVHYCNSGVIGSVSINCSNGCSESNNEGKCNPIKTLGRYCKDGTNLWEAVSNPSNIEDGGVSIQKVVTCNVVDSIGGCITGPPATCSPIHTLGKFCGGSEGKVLYEASSNTASSNLANGFVTINTIRTCGLSCRQNLTSIPTDASCATECDGETECSNGVVKNCVQGEMTTIRYSCNGGCSEVNREGVCSPIHTLGKFCGTGSNAKTLFEAVTDNTATLDGNIKINKIVDCMAACINDENTAQCSRYKEPGYYCDGTKLMLSELDTSNSQFSIPYGGILTSLVKQCPASCNQITISAPTTAECILDCNPNIPVCRSNGIWSCTTDGLYGSLIDQCKDSSGISLGCSEQTNRCKDECPVKTMDICKLGDAYRCLGVDKPYTNISQLLLVKQESCTGGCDAGVCIKECTGDINCYPTTGNLHACNNGVRETEPVVVCKNGCDQTSNQCINECTPEGKIECIGTNSRTCLKNVTTFDTRDYFQYIWKETICGSQGCNPTTGQCNAKQANSFYCVGDNLYSTDSNGYLSPNPITDGYCAAKTPINGRDFYCPVQDSSGLSSDNACHVCELNEVICTSNEIYQCADPRTGEKKAQQSCQVGCLNQGGNYYCDQLASLVSLNQNFVTGTDVRVIGTLTRSKSYLGLIITNIKGTLTGGGQNNIVTAASDSSGQFDLNFGKDLPLGTYNVLVEIPDYNTTYSITAKVSNDYRIELAESVALIKYPQINPSALLKISGGEGSPEDIIVIGNYEGLSSIDITKDNLIGKWLINVQGNPGIYHINVSAVSNGVNQDIQTIPIEIRNPTLTISSNLPASSKPGKQDIQVKVSGPTSKNQPSAGLVPDTITATLNNQNVELKNQGSGSYIIENTFELGTYTLLVDAQKAGYDSPSGGYSKTISVTSSGTGGGTGNQTGACTLNSDCSSGYVCTNGQCTKGGFELDTKTLLILGAVGIIGYFLLRKRRR